MRTSSKSLEKRFSKIGLAAMVTVALYMDCCALPKVSALLEEKSYKDCRIVFESNRDGNWEIYVMNIDGSKQKRLTYDSAHDEFPSWSPFSFSM